MTVTLLLSNHVHSLAPARPAHVISTDQEAIDIARRLAAQFKTGAQGRDAERELPWKELDAFAESGLLAIRVPRAWGGACPLAQPARRSPAKATTGSTGPRPIPPAHCSQR